MKWQGRDDDDMLVLYKSSSSSRRWVVVLCWGFLVCSAGEGMGRATNTGQINCEHCCCCFWLAGWLSPPGDGWEMFML